MKYIQANVRIPEQDISTLKAISDRENKSLNLLVTEALKQYLGQGEKGRTGGAEAIDALKGSIGRPGPALSILREDRKREKGT